MMKSFMVYFRTALLCVMIMGQGIPLPTAQAQATLAGHTMVPILLGLKIHPENPLLFDFIVDRGQAKLSEAEFKAETEKLIKYFLTALTIPDKESWVNLSPYEANRIMPDALGKTEMGKTMLQQDYVLKQLAASLTNPETALGKRYWENIGTDPAVNGSDPVFSTLNKVWIVPAKAKVLENNGIVLIDEKKLKVLMQDRSVQQRDRRPEFAKGADHEGGDAVFQEMILPKINEFVNESQDFAAVRQVYHSVILAAWYKQALKESLLGKVYVDQAKVAGVETSDREVKERVYQQYLAAFKKGAYNFIQEEENSDTGEVIPRKYFSGGVNISAFGDLAGSSLVTEHVKTSLIAQRVAAVSSLAIVTIVGTEASKGQESGAVASAPRAEAARASTNPVAASSPLTGVAERLKVHLETYKQEMKRIQGISYSGNNEKLYDQKTQADRDEFERKVPFWLTKGALDGSLAGWFIKYLNLRAYHDLMKVVFAEMAVSQGSDIAIYPFAGADPVIGLLGKVISLTIDQDDFTVASKLAGLLQGEDGQRQFQNNLLEKVPQTALDIQKYEQIQRAEGQHFIFIMKGFNGNWFHTQEGDSERIDNMLQYVLLHVLKPGDQILILFKNDRDRYLPLMKQAGFVPIIDEHFFRGYYGNLWENKIVILPDALVLLEKRETAASAVSQLEDSVVPFEFSFLRKELSHRDDEINFSAEELAGEQAKFKQLMAGLGIDVFRMNREINQLFDLLLELRKTKYDLNRKYYFTADAYLDCDLYSDQAIEILAPSGFAVRKKGRTAIADKKVYSHTFVELDAMGKTFVLDLTAEQFNKRIIQDLSLAPEYIPRYADLGIVLIPKNVIEQGPEKYWMYTKGNEAKFVGSSGIASPGSSLSETVQATEAREPLTASSPFKDFLQQYFGKELSQKADVDKSYYFPGSEAHNVLSAPRATHPFIAQHLLSFKDFMDLALHHPDWGFYSSGKVKFLVGHDFVTYPKILSPFFGQAVANQALQVWQKMREQNAIASDEKFSVVEFGAGDATLARDFLNYVTRQAQEDSVWKTFYEQMEYRIYERSAVLRKRQKGELIEFKGKVQILEGDARKPLNSLSQNEIKGMIITNEVPDAFGVHKIIVRESGEVEVGFVLPSVPYNFMTLFGTAGIPDKLLEKMIQANLDIKFAWGQDGGLNPQVIYLTQDTYTDLLTWAQYALSEGDLIQFLYYLKFNEIYLPVEYAPEVARYLKENIDEIALGMAKKSQRLVSAVNLYVNTEAMSFAEGLAKSLHSGIVVTIDYGESLAELIFNEGAINKLRTYGPNHVHNHDPYFQVSMQDITTEQDFTTLATVGEKFGLEQTHFGSLKGFFARTQVLSKFMYVPAAVNDSSFSVAVDKILAEQDHFKVLTQVKGVQLQGIYDKDITSKGFGTLKFQPHGRFANGAQVFAKDFTDRFTKELQHAIAASSGVNQKPWDDQEWFTFYDFLRSDVKSAIAQAVKNVIQKHLPSSDDPVVELGSGQGFFASLVPELQPRLIQTDFIGESLKRNSQPTAKLVTNAEALAIADQSVSTIVGYDFLDALPDFKKTAQEIFRVLKPDGQMLGFLDFAPHYEPAINYTRNIKNEILFLAPQVDPRTGKIAMRNYARVNADELRYRLSQARHNARGQIDEALNYLDQYLRDPKTELGHVMQADDPKVQYEYSVNMATLLNRLGVYFRVVSQEDVYKEMVGYYLKKGGFNTVDFTMESGMIDYDRQDFLGFPDDKNVYEYRVGKKTNLYDPSIPKGKIRVIAHLLVVRAQKTDRASASVEANEATRRDVGGLARQDLGGIDFDPSKLNLQIKRDGKGVPLPLPQQNIENIHLDGLSPVIISIQPVNHQTLPLLLGQAGSKISNGPPT